MVKVYSILPSKKITIKKKKTEPSASHVLKQLLYSQLFEGKRSVGGQKKRYKDTLKVSLKGLNIEVGSWETPPCS